MKVRSVMRLIKAVRFRTIFPVQGHDLTPIQVFDKVRDAVVVVKILDAQGNGIGQGSGVILSSGRVATTCHAVEGGASYQVVRDTQLIPATLYAEDSDKDICLLDAEGIQGKPAQLGKAARLEVGDPVYAVGAPEGLEPSFSDGVVAQLRGGPSPLIQTTAAISPGSVGGGLFDRQGRLVGLTTLYRENGKSLNFAMPVEWIDGVKPGHRSGAEGRGHTAWLKRAVALEAAKDWQGMLDWCREWTKSQPENGDAWYGLGNAYGYLDHRDDAVEGYRRAIEIDPKYAKAWNNLGIAYRRLDRYTEAVEAFRRVIEIDPKYAKAWYNLGLAYTHLNRYNDAVEAYRRAISIDPEYTKAWNNLGSAYDDLKRYDEAIDAYRQAIRIDPKHSPSWHNLGLAYKRLDRHDDAAEAYRQAIRTDPSYARIWYNLGLAYTHLDRHDDAAEAYRQAIRIDPKLIDAWSNLGVAYDMAGNRAAAMDAVRELRRLDPAQADKLFNRIVSHRPLDTA